jgi:hypothetical protein
MYGLKSPVKNGVLFQETPPSARDFAFDAELGYSGAVESAPEGTYDPYATHIPLLPSRRLPQTLSLSGLTYQEFDAQHLYAKQDAFTPSPAASETDFLKTPLSALFPAGLPKPPRRHPFASGYEAPEWTFILIHVGFCVLAYPILLVFVVIANNRTLFWSRLVVGVGCGAVGVALGLSLARLGQRFLEAASMYFDSLSSFMLT